MPELDDTIEIAINPDDLKLIPIEQVVPVVSILIKQNRLFESHIFNRYRCRKPSTTFSIKNREQAMSMLKAKLYQLEMEKKAQKQQVYVVNKWKLAGAQIRSYVFHPYSMVKDHRTNETGNVQAVMDGDLDGFIDAYLKQRLS